MPSKTLPKNRVIPWINLQSFALQNKLFYPKEYQRRCVLQRSYLENQLGYPTKFACICLCCLMTGRLLLRRVLQPNGQEQHNLHCYLSTLRNGYNYDMRAKERTQIAGGASLGAQAITSAAAIIGGIATSNPIGVVAGIGMGVSFVTSLISYAKTTIDNEEAINRKLDEAKRQAVSVSAVDDIDLLRAYSNNKAKICYYRMNEEVKKAIYDIFFYCGYTCNYQDRPNITSRCWFNFLQAEAEIENHKNLSEEIINNLKEKFKNGVTFFHKYNGSYNIERNLENVEMSILGGNE